MKTHTFAAVALLAILAGCIQTTRLPTEFDPAAHAYAVTPGRASVTGQAFMRRNNGAIYTAAGSLVVLLPYTAYTREMYASTTGGPGEAARSSPDKRLMEYVKTTRANRQGRFSFRGVPDGEYLLVTEVSWTAGGRRHRSEISQVVTVSAGRDMTVTLST